MPRNSHILYSGDEAGFLSKLQELWKPDEDEKAKVIVEHLDNARSVLDLGCGSGQLLKRLAGKVLRLVGVDENREMLEKAARNCPSAELVRTKAEDMEFREEFDVVVTSQMLHEVRQFGTAGQMDRVLRAIWDALNPGGRYFLLDHLDPGEGKVTVRLRQDDALLQEFVRKFRCRRVQFRKLEPGLYEMERRDLQDFVTKTWALRGPMEEIEMKETHAAFSEEEAKGIVRGAGFSPERFITLTNMRRGLEDHGMELQGESPWDRKFLLISSKSP